MIAKCWRKGFCEVPDKNVRMKESFSLQFSESLLERAVAFKANNFVRALHISCKFKDYFDSKITFHKFTCTLLPSIKIVLKLLKPFRWSLFSEKLLQNKEVEHINKTIVTFLTSGCCHGAAVSSQSIVIYYTNLSLQRQIK